MVKFGKNYGAYISSEYKDANLDYDKLKELIHAEEKLVKAAAAEARPADNVGSERNTQMSERTERKDNPSVSDSIRAGIMRIEAMYESRLNALETEFTDLRRAAWSYIEKKKVQSSAAAKASEGDLKRSCTSFYNDLMNLESYRLLNHTACIKIIKKHDKELCPPYDPLYEGGWSDELPGLLIGTQGAGNSLVERVEKLYADTICGGEMLEAQGKLRMAKGNYRSTDLVMMAFKAGILLTLILWMINVTLIAPELATDFYTLKDSSVYVYAFTGAFVIYRWVWGICAFFWEEGRIRYISLFDLDDSKHAPNFVFILSNACSWSILYMVNIIVYYSLKMAYISNQRGILIPAWLLPTSLTMIAIFFLLNASLQKGSHGLISRKMLLDFLVPWTVPVTIRHIIATDVMTSLCKVFISMCYATCYYYTGAFLRSPNVDAMEKDFGVCLVSPAVHHASIAVCVIPFSIRWLQCARQQYDSLIKNGKIEPIEWRYLFCWWKKSQNVYTEANAVVEESSVTDEVGPFTDGEVEESESGVQLKSMPEPSPSPSSRRRVSVITEQAAKESGKPNKTLNPRSKRFRLSRSESRETLDPRWCAPIIDHLPRRVSKVTELLIVWPYTFNMLKYTLSIIVVVMGGYPPDPSSPSYNTYLGCFYAVSVISTLYSCYWDFKNDWGLFQDYSDYPLLRPQLKYRNMIWYYYCCLILNPIFRCFWTLSFSPNATSPFLPLFELLRRCMWTILRLEWAQINDDKQTARLPVEPNSEPSITVKKVKV